MSMGELARAAGISNSLMHRIETDPEANPTLGTLQKICAALGISFYDLIFRWDYQKRKLADTPSSP